MVGRIYQDQKDYERAIQHYRDLKDRFPQNRFHDEAWWRIGWLRYSQGRHRDAQKEFSKALSSGVQPSWRGEFLYWLGRSLENNGKTEEAKGVYLRLRQGGTETYYSVLADERLKKLKVTLPDPGFPPSSGTLGSDPQSFPEEVLFHLQRSRELSEVRAPQLAAQELDAIRSHLPLNPELALVVLAEYGKNRLPHKGISLALHLMQRENSKEILPSLERYAYPLGFYDLIRAVASDRNLDPYLVAALIRQESLFDPMATSPANAQGLMQILPSTGLRYMTSEQQGDPRKRGFYEPSTNIQIGVAYLQGLLQRYGGDLTRVLAAYNAGEKAVAKWETDFPNAPPEVFAENITYSETRLYVKLVLRNYAIYKRIYGRASR
jgi:soluble lytic murein transglycosylase